MKSLNYTISIDLHNDSFKYVENCTHRKEWLSVSIGVFTKGRAIYDTLTMAKSRFDETIKMCKNE